MPSSRRRCADAIRAGAVRHCGGAAAALRRPTPSRCRPGPGDHRCAEPRAFAAGALGCRRLVRVNGLLRQACPPGDPGHERLLRLVRTGRFGGGGPGGHRRQRQWRPPSPTRRQRRCPARAVARQAECREQGAQILNQRVRRRWRPSFETAQCAAQPSDAHAQLVNVLHARRGVAFAHAGCIARHLREAFVEHRAEGHDRRRIGGVVGPACFAHRRKRRSGGELVAALGLAARIEDQAVALPPAFGQRDHGER